MGGQLPVSLRLLPPGTVVCLLSIIITNTNHGCPTLRPGGTVLQSSCFGNPTRKDFGGFPRKARWSGLESSVIAYKDLFAGQFNQHDTSDTAFRLPTSPDVGFQGIEFQALGVDAWWPSLCWSSVSWLTWEPCLRALGLCRCWQCDRTVGMCPEGVDLIAVRVRFPRKLCSYSPPS